MKEPPKIEIRPYHPDDLETLIDLFNGSVRTIAARDYSPAQIAAWAPEDIDRERWRTRHSSKPAWVAEIDGRPVGFIDLEPDGHLDMLFVHAEFQRRGVASALLAQVERAAVEQGISRIFTEASITAKPFFESRGFRVIKPQTVRWRGQEFLNYRMEKPLTSLVEGTTHELS
jgi:putative acetyltransferase